MIKLTDKDILVAMNFMISKHGFTLDANGDLYIFHPIRVATYLIERGCSELKIVCALLHDVVEDCYVGRREEGLDDIERYFGTEAREILDVMSHDKNDKDYDEYIGGIISSAYRDITREIKLADINDNTLIWRLDHFPEDRRKRMEDKYEKAESRIRQSIYNEN
jgi:(p)ppGpp synthase/HD superfamily hydrolase